MHPAEEFTNKLDALNDRLMYRLQYRKFGASDERLVVTHSVRASKGHSGLRWYELTDDGAGWAIANQGTYSPDRPEEPVDGQRRHGRRGQHRGRVLAVEQRHLSRRSRSRAAWRVRRRHVRPQPNGRCSRASWLREKASYSRWGDYSDMTVATRTAARSSTPSSTTRRPASGSGATRIVSFQLPGCLPLGRAPTTQRPRALLPGASRMSPVSFFTSCACRTCSCRRCAMIRPTPRSPRTACCCAAGFVRASMSGVYTLLPLALRVMGKIEAIVREEMEAAGSIEVRVPIVLPAEPWKATGRWQAYGNEVFKLEDRHGREMMLGPTEEEVVRSPRRGRPAQLSRPADQPVPGRVEVPR